MIDEDRTMQLFGYTSDELSKGSHKKIVAVCEECGTYRCVQKREYSDLCFTCSRTGENNYGWVGGDVNKMCEVPCFGEMRPYEVRKRVSATLQCISYDEWESFAEDHPYCPKFNEVCRESNREKYDRCCFLSGMTEEENGKKLSVHHIDMDKTQGCDGHTWKLVPLAAKWHGRAHTQTLVARIQYLLTHIWGTQ